jgi:hypothetical protein
MSAPFNYFNTPIAANNPASDQPNMQTNFGSIKSLIDIDHQDFNVATAGQHTQVTFPITRVDPAITGAVGMAYTKDIAGVAQFFFANSLGTTQLTGITSSLVANGYYTFAGGLILKWGTATSSKTGTAFSFPTGAGIPVFTNIWSFVATVSNQNAASTPVAVWNDSLSPTGCTLYSTNTTNTIKYMALGN